MDREEHKDLFDGFWPIIWITQEEFEALYPKGEIIMPVKKGSKGKW